jgi:hypothetical protein
MTGPDGGRHWDPQPGDAERIRRHLDRQRDLPADRVRLDNGQVVPVGQDAEGESDGCR